MASLRKENTSPPFVVFDIGSASVGAALFVFDTESGKIDILYQTRIFMAFQDSLDKEQLFSVTISAIKRAGENIQKNGVNRLADSRIKIKNIKDVFCILASPWYKAEVKNLKFGEERSFTVSSKFITTILNEESEKFIDQDDKLVEEKVIQILLNGYNTDDPYGKEADTIDTTLFISSMSKNVQNKMADVLEGMFTSSDVSFGTFPLALFSVTRDMFKTEKSFLLLDIGGEMTDIALIRDETIKKIHSFNLGKNFLIRKVKKSLNLIHEEAHSLIRLFMDGKSMEPESSKMKIVLSEARDEWLSKLRVILSEFSEGISLPKTVILTVDSDIAKWFVETIKNDEFSSYTLAEEPFTVVELSSRILNEYCKMPKDSLRGCDPFLAIEALFIHKIVNQ